MIPSADFIQHYAPNVAPQTIAAIIRVESGGNQFAIGINGPVKRRIRPKSVQEAASEANYFIAQGYSVDLGLMQINSRNLSSLGLTVEQAFDPGINIQAGAKILIRGYRGAIKRYGLGQDALRAALSAYNTGNYEQGFKNGYVAKYYLGSGGTFGFRLNATNPASYRYRMVPLSPKGMQSKAAIINPYTVELMVYQQGELPKLTTVKEIYPLHTPDIGVNIAESPF